MRAWWAMFGTKAMVELRPEDRKWLEEWSGGIPILLRELINIDELQSTPEILHGQSISAPAINAPSSTTIIGRTSRSGSTTPSAVTDSPARDSDNREATFGGMTDQLFQRFQRSQAVEGMRLSISAFYGHHMHQLKGQHPSTWTK